MPYIPENIRKELIEDCPIFLRDALSAGELNYLIARLMHHHLKDVGVSYQTLNELIGVLECCKQELYRTVVGPYENKKRLENGSVSELDDNSHERMR